MNKGAILLEREFFSPTEISDIAGVARACEGEKFSVHQGGKYADLNWHQVNLAPEQYPWLKRLYEYLGTEQAELSVFYYLSSGANLHPHRDLTGASMNNRLRFHVPVYTHDLVEFRVADERIRMRPGELWCLDTSYKHSVFNGGPATRAHIVIECNINDRIKSLLPARDLKDRAHDAFFWGLMAQKLISSFVVNGFKDPGALRVQMQMIWRFIKWRVLKIERPV